MNLKLVEKYKSIQTLPIAQLPALTILTGENGSGKTHLLNAIREGAIVLNDNDIDLSGIKYYTWENMVPSYQTGVVPKNLEYPSGVNQIIALSEGVAEDMLVDINHKVKSLGLNLLIDKKHLIGFADNSFIYTELPGQIREIISNVVNEYRICIKGMLLAGIRDQTIAVQYKWPQIQQRYGGIYQKNMGFQPTYLNKSQCVLILRIIKDKVNFFNLSKEEVSKSYPLLEETIDPFRGSLTALFAAYINEREKNDMNEIRYRRGDAEGFMTDGKFIDAFGLPPWDILNEVLNAAKLPFRFKKPHPDASKQLEVQLEHTEADAIVSFWDLSSGERILISLAQFVFLSSYGRQLIDMPEVILLDEVDAPLHPSMAADMLRIIKDVMVTQYGLRVIMVTHSPSTVALAPEESLYVLEKTSKQIRKVSRDEGIRVLTSGVPVLSVKIENRRQVFVESEYDASCYEYIVEILKKHLNPEISFVFIPSGTKGGGSCDRVKDLVNKLSEGGSQSVFGVVDWDLHYNGNEKVRVLGRGQRYSIENYIFDPLSVAILMYQMRLVDRDLLTLQEEQTFADLRNFNDAQLQVVVDNLLQYLKFPLKQGEPTRTCAYLNGRVVQVPIAYLEMQGHALEAIIKNTSPNFGKFRNDGALKLEIIDKVFGEMPGFISIDFIELLHGIQFS